jgi:hypothetical protein
MALDPSIALGIRPLEIPNQLAQYAQMAQVENAQRQGEVAQMQLEQLKQDRVEMLGFQKFLADSGDNPDLKQFATRLLRSPKHYEKGVEMMQKLQEQEKFETMGRKLYPELFGAAPAGAAPMGAPPVAGAMPMAAPTARPSGALGSGTFGMMPEPVNNLAPAPAAPSNALVAPAGKTPDQLRKEIILFGGSNAPGAKNMVDMLKAQLTESLKQTDTQREMQSLGLPLTPEGFKQYKALSQTPTAPPSMVAEYTFAKTPDGGNFRGSYQDFVTARAAAGRAPAQPAQPSAPVAVIDPATGQPIYVSREDALRNRMQPAANAPALKPLTEGQTIKLRTDVGKDYKAATTALSQMDDLLESIEAVKTAPGLSAATGFTGKYLPSFPEGKAAQAETRIANLRGKVTALGKATAAMSGSIGSIANQEWKILSDQIAALDEVKGAGPLLEQIALVEAQALRSMNLIRDTYEKTRAEDFERFPQFRDLPAPRSRKNSGGGNIEALLDKYK